MGSIRHLPDLKPKWGPKVQEAHFHHSMKTAAATATPPNTTSPPVASGVAAFEVGVGLEVCEPIPELAPEAVVLVVVPWLVESFVGVASALLAADETWAE